MANFTYDQFLKKAKETGLYGSFSDADLNLAKQNADAGMSILQHKQDYAKATTDEQRSAANMAAEKIRSQYGNYTAGSDGKGFYINGTTQRPTVEVYKPSDAVQQAQAAVQQGAASKPGAYQPGEAVQQAMAMLNQQLASKPGAYQSQWQAGLNQIMDKILNREKFSYDMNADALYQQYKDQYTLLGQQAMMDTMGQAQAMTGGYGNSYAQTVGQQTYQGYLQQLNDKIPELYQLALDRYNREGQEMYNQYGLMADRESMDYDRYRDTVADWNNAYDRAYQQYQNERNFDYGQHRDAVADWNNAYDRAYQMYQDERSFDYGQYADNRGFQYQQDRDAVADRQWQSQYDEAKRQWQAEFDEAKRQYDQQYGLKTASSGGSSSGGSSGGSSGSSSGGGNYDNGTVSSENVKKIQTALGVTADGKWGAESQSAAKAKWGVTSAVEAWDALIPDHTPQSAVQPAGGDGFTGTTYKEAVDYLKDNGVDSASAASAMTATEWARRKSAGASSAEVANYSTYKEYLADFVEHQMSKK